MALFTKPGNSIQNSSYARLTVDYSKRWVRFFKHLQKIAGGQGKEVSPKCNWSELIAVIEPFSAKKSSSKYSTSATENSVVRTACCWTPLNGPFGDSQALSTSRPCCTSSISAVCKASLTPTSSLAQRPFCYTRAHKQNYNTQSVLNCMSMIPLGSKTLIKERTLKNIV